jgi:hypothetical protein
MELAGTPLLPCQPCPALAVAVEALYGQDLWPALATAACPPVAPVWVTDPSLEPSQLLSNAQEEGLLADTPGVPPPSSEGGQHQSMVFEAWTKNPLVDEGTFPIIFHLPHHASTSHEPIVAHLPLEYPLIRTCYSTSQPHNIVLQAPCDLSIPWAMELRICSQDILCGLTEYQP